MRFFFALWPDDSTRARIAAAAARLLAGARCRPVKPANLHLTLVFIGDVADARLPALLACADGVAFEPLTLSLAVSGRFERAGIAWIAPEAPPAALLGAQRTLAERVAGAGFGLESRPYHPHVTIARRFRDRPAGWQGPPIEWTARSFVLCRSDNGRYSVIASYPR